MKKVIVITGCSSGIGLCLAKSLAQTYTVIATARNLLDIQHLQSLGLETYQLDLASSTCVDECSMQILKKYPNIYAVIHNGAYGQVGALLDISREVLEQQFATNVFGTHQLTNNFLPSLIAQDSSRIIYISSVLGFVCAPLRGPYNASKFALEGLAGTLRLELARTSVKVSTIQPGPITSKFRENVYNAFKQNVNTDNSMYQEQYKQMIARLENTQPSKWTLPPEAVLKKVIHALEKNPKNHYKVTTPTIVIWLLQKILPSKIIDKILIKQ